VRGTRRKEIWGGGRNDIKALDGFSNSIQTKAPESEKEGRNNGKICLGGQGQQERGGEGSVDPDLVQQHLALI